MASTIKIKRSGVSGRQPNTATLSVGELAINYKDQKLYSSNGTSVFEIGGASGGLVSTTTKTLDALKGSDTVITGVTAAVSTNYLQVANAVSTYATKASPTTSGLLAHTGRATISTNLAVSGNVGIGTSSPTYQVTVGGYGQETAALTDAGNKGGSIYLRADAVGVGSGGAVLFGTTFGNGTPFAAIKALIADGGTNTRGDLAFATRNATTDTALTERMRISSAGYITMPYQPAFYAFRAGSTITTTNADFIFDSTRINRGNCYNTSNGRFTAPVAGAYFITATGLPNSTTNAVLFRILKNNSTWSTTAYVINADETVTLSCVVDMAVNDYVTVYVSGDGMESLYSSFSGFLIG